MLKIYAASCGALKDDNRLEQVIAKMPGPRQKAVLRYARKTDRRRSAAVSLLLYRALSDAGISWDSYRESPGGKPHLADHPEAFFSLSHSGDMVLCALSDAPVGCDIERLRPANLRVARRFFTEEEQDYVFSGRIRTEEQDPMACIGDLASEDPRLADAVSGRNAFFSVWTRKESFLKMTGEGVGRKLRSFSVLDGCDDKPSGHDPVHLYQKEVAGRTVTFEEILNIPGYRAACCTNGCPGPAHYQYIDLEDIRL